MEFLKIIFTKTLDEKSFRQELSNIIEILNNNKIQSVDILFGVAWGNIYRNWIPFTVDIANIEFEISKVEELKVGKLRDDDFYITIADLEIEILFCHESDIHLSFNNLNPLATDIIKSWD